MRPTDGAALSLVLAGALVLSLTFTGMASFSLTSGGGGGGGVCPVALTVATPEYGYVAFSGGACTSSGAIAPAGTVVYYSFTGPGVSESGQTQVSGSEGQFSGSADVPYSANGVYALVVSVCPDAASSCALYPSGGSASVNLSLGQGASGQATTTTTTTTTSKTCASNCGGGKFTPFVGYLLALALFVSGALVFAIGREEEG